MRNKYKIASVLLFYFSMLMIIVIAIYLLIDYQNYLKHPEYSAPFSVSLILIYAAYGIPIIIGLVLSKIFKKKAIRYWWIFYFLEVVLMLLKFYIPLNIYNIRIRYLCSSSQHITCSLFKLANQFYFYKIIHEFSKANIPDAGVNKWKWEKN